MGKIWFEVYSPDKEEYLWFETFLCPERRAAMLEYVYTRVAVPDTWRQHVEQELLIFLWIHGLAACGDRRSNLYRLALELVDYEVRNERQRIKRANQKKNALDETWAMPELDLQEVDLFDTLPERQKEAARLYYGEGWTEQQAADIMGITQQAVAALLHKAKKTLREKINEG